MLKNFLQLQFMNFRNKLACFFQVGLSSLV